jgi:pimeloyl-ACP methyl ester carboxylesterase
LRSIRANEIEIAFEDLGSGSPLLLLHGFARDHTVWDTPAKALKEKYRVIVPDLRGMGGSRHPDPGSPITMEQLADDSAALLDSLNVQTAMVAGFSMGGYILLEMLLRHPSRVQAAAFVGTRASADRPEKKAERLKQNEQLLEEGMAPLAKEYVQRLFSFGFSAANPQILEETYQNFASQEPVNIALLNDAMRNRGDLMPRLDEIQCPCVVIGGSEDKLVAPEAMVALHEGLRDSTLDMVEGAGHMLPVETPNRVVAALENLMKRTNIGRV